ncbi:MAG: hypothetical protein LBP36_04255 [Oscillospiraceae bacterium]|jgi:hypothetical protein|nr:hypothetical protein [Oscillospiraceae bacterium]
MFRNFCKNTWLNLNNILALSDEGGTTLRIITTEGKQFTAETNASASKIILGLASETENNTFQV